MTTYVALLRAVNVGGTGKLSMADLKAMCTDIGFDRVETYIASGNVVFDSSESSGNVESRLANRLHAYAGSTVGVLVRTAAQMKLVLDGNPFADKEPNRTYAFFLPAAPTAAAVRDVRGQADEDVRLGRQEIYVYYPSGMGQSKLRMAAAAVGTARNFNTIAKLVSMSARHPGSGGGAVRGNQG